MSTSKKRGEVISKFFIKLNIFNFKDVLNSDIVLPILFVVLHTCVCVMYITLLGNYSGLFQLQGMDLN